MREGEGDASLARNEGDCKMVQAGIGASDEAGVRGEGVLTWEFHKCYGQSV
jgi:hypothetical protein